MNPTIYLSCLVVIIGSLVWTASAQQDFEADRARVIEIFKDANSDSISDANVLFLVNFLDKHGDQVKLTPDQRQRAANVVRQYKERASQPLVDGVPPQGGFWTKLVRAIVVQLGIELASEGVKKATSKD